MFRSAVVVFSIMLGLATFTQASVVITRSDAPTVGLAGFTTVTLTAATDNGSQIHGFDFASQSSYGFFGSMNQVNPAGASTVFQDDGSIFPVPDLSRDSHFNFVARSLTIPAGFASESNSHLRALFASGTPLGTSVPFVQLVIPNASAATVNYVGQVTTWLLPAGPVDNDVAGSIPVPIPEPTSAVLLCAALSSLATLGRNRGHREIAQLS